MQARKVIIKRAWDGRQIAKIFRRQRLKRTYQNWKEVHQERGYTIVYTNGLEKIQILIPSSRALRV